MDNILSEIYRGSYDPFGRREKSEQPEAWKVMNHLEEELKARMPEELLPLLERYIEARELVAFSACEDDFIAGYRMGVRLTAAGLSRSE